MDVDECGLTEDEAFRVRDLLETVVERAEAPDLLHEHPEAVMFVVKVRFGWTADMPVSAEDETDQLYRFSTRRCSREGPIDHVRWHRETICPSAGPI